MKAMTIIMYFNILPLIAVGFMLMQQKMMTPPPADEQQEMQQKMMKIMIIVMAVFFYKVAAGLCLATAIVGCLRPTLLAARVDPLTALRAE